MRFVARQPSQLQTAAAWVGGDLDASVVGAEDEAGGLVAARLDERGYRVGSDAYAGGGVRVARPAFEREPAPGCTPVW